MYKITIAIPVFNVEKYVEKSLLSALIQTYQNIEFLIVDDKSTDNTMNIVRQVLNGHPRAASVKIIDHGINKGLGDTRNTSINEATGEYIYFMDSDDTIIPECIEILIKYMEENPVDFVAGSRERRTFEGQLIAIDEYEPALVDEGEELSVARFRYVENHKILGEIWNKLYKLSFLRDNRIQCIPGVHVEDVSFSYQVNLFAKSCRLVSDITYSYKIHEGQSFTAFQNNLERSLYLSDCFIKIRQYDVLVAKRFEQTKEYGALLAGIYNVTLLHAMMIAKSSIMDNKLKKILFAELLIYNIDIISVLKLYTKRKYNLIYYILCNLPVLLRSKVISLIYR